MNTRHNLRTFYILIITQVFSQIGSRMTGLALGIYVFNQTGEATPLALVALFSFLPMVIMSGVAGVLADRWDRRYVMVLSDAGQALGTVILLFTFLNGSFSVEILYVITFLQSIFGVFQGPAFTASVTMLVPDNQRDRANAIQQLTGPTAGVLAPAIAGVLYAAVGVNGVIVFDLITFVSAVVVVMLMHIPRPVQSEVGRAMQGSLLKESFAGLRYLWARRTLFLVMLDMSLVNFLFAVSTVLLTPYLLALFKSEATLGVLLSVLDAGAIIGGVIIGVWGGTKLRVHTIFPGIIFSGVFLAAVGIARTPMGMGIALFLMVIASPMINAVAMSLMQVKVPPDIQGRVFATMGQISMLLIPLAYLAAGPLADQVFEPAVGTPAWDRFAPLVGSAPGSGIGLIMVIAGVTLVVTTALVYVVPRVRRMEADLPDYVPQPAEPTGMPEFAAVAE